MYYLVEGFIADEDENVIAFSESKEFLKQKMEELINIETSRYSERNKKADNYISEYHQFSESQKKYFNDKLAEKLIDLPEQKPKNQIENDNWRKIIAENKQIALRNKTNCAAYVTMICNEWVQNNPHPEFVSVNRLGIPVRENRTPNVYWDIRKVEKSIYDDPHSSDI